MTKPEDLPYAIEGRKVIAEPPELRVQILTFKQNQFVPWHPHSTIAVTNIEVGDVYAVPPNFPRRVGRLDDGACRFAIFQGIGVHNYHPVEVMT